ncbi:MAG: NAD(P)H-hydrate dehydratase [Chloroflexi bacterium]|nr:NAD(P)H-hydrate dehydratase [Chloroflexota bacterium]
MKIVNIKQMRDLESLSAEQGITPEMLMEKAGMAVAKEILKSLDDDFIGSNILVLVGPGNNGGDGLVAARYLHDWGANVQVYLCTARKDDSNLIKVKKREIVVTDAGKDNELSDLNNMLNESDVVIDSILGTGKVRQITGTIKEILEAVTNARKRNMGILLVAVDLSSGIDADRGNCDPSTVKADLTVTFAYPKIGFFTFPAADYVGELAVVDIGIPSELAAGINTEVIVSERIKEVLPERPDNANKGTFGKVLVVAGSSNYIGAAYLACAAAYRVGAGLVTLATTKSIIPTIAAKLAEVTYIPLPEDEEGIIGDKAASILKEVLGNYNALLIGCGLGREPATVEFIYEFLLSAPLKIPVIIDADALNIISGAKTWWDKIADDTIITPHPGEMSRLTGFNIDHVEQDRLKLVPLASSQWKKTIILKGAHTIVACKDGRMGISVAANAGLASAGTGDVLSGIIAGLLAQGLESFNAATCGVYLHAKAGEIVTLEIGNAGLIASDLLPVLPEAIMNIKFEE